MTVIKQEHLIQSVADALQFISYYHPVDFIRAMVEAYEKERSPAAKAALQQVLVNSRMCALGKRPICQDTGIVIAFLTLKAPKSGRRNLPNESTRSTSKNRPKDTNSMHRSTT